MSKRWTLLAPVAAVVVAMTGCVTDPNSPGLEYMPDMYRSQAIEAYVDYGLVGDVEHSELKNSISARLPVDGTIPYNDDKQMAAINMPFNYGAGEDERIRADNEVVIPADSTLEVFAGQKIVVETTDVITIGAKTASTLDATLSVMEIT